MIVQVRTVDIKNMSRTQKERFLKKLYGDFYELEITLERDSIRSNPSIYLKDFTGVPDCCVSNFYHNYYFRTKKGVQGEKYSTLGTLIRELKKEITRNGFKINSNIRVYYHREHVFSIHM